MYESCRSFTLCIIACKPGFVTFFKFYVSCMVDEMGRLRTVGD